MRWPHLILLLSLALSVPLVRAEEEHLQFEKVGESVYLVRPRPGDIEAVSNAAFIVMPDRVMVFDTLSSPSLMQEMMVMIRRTTDLPIKMLVLSHYHPDHTGGMAFFNDRDYTLYVGPGTARRITEQRAKEMQFLTRRQAELGKKIQEVWGTSEVEPFQEKLREVKAKIAEMDTLPPPNTDQVVDGTVTSYPGNRMVFLNHPGHCHTGGDLMVYLPDEQILLAGDAVTTFTLPNLADADTDEWILRLNQIEKMGARHIVPGHGPLGTNDDVRALRNYLLKLQEMVRPIAREGTVEDLVARLRVPSPYDLWDAQDLWFPATLKVFQEMRAGAAP